MWFKQHHSCNMRKTDLTKLPLLPQRPITGVELNSVLGFEASRVQAIIARHVYQLFTLQDVVTITNYKTF